MNIDLRKEYGNVKKIFKKGEVGFDNKYVFWLEKRIDILEKNMNVLIDLTK